MWSISSFGGSRGGGVTGVATISGSAPALYHAFLESLMETVRKSVINQLPGD